MAEYISIAEAARRANISKQAIYQRLNKDLNKYVKVIDGKKQLHTDCLEILLKHVDSSSQQDCSTSLNQFSTTDAKTQTILLAALFWININDFNLTSFIPIYIDKVCVNNI